MTTAHLARPLIPPQPTFAYFRFPPEVIVVKVAGRWRYVYRAIDQFGQVIDVLVSPRRDATAARRFFEQAIDTTKASPTRGGDRPGTDLPAGTGGAAASGLASHGSVRINGVKADHCRPSQRLRRFIRGD
jgi:DDE domain